MIREDDQFDSSRNERPEDSSQALLDDTWSSTQMERTAVDTAVQTVSTAVQELPDLILGSAETELYSATLAAATVSEDITTTSGELADVARRGAERFADGVARLASGETTVDEFASSTLARARQDAAHIFIQGGNAAFRTAETAANVAESAGYRAVDTAIDGATRLADAGNEAVDILAQAGVIDPELVQTGREIASLVGTPAIEAASEVLGDARAVAGEATTAVFDAARSAVDVAGEILPHQLGGAITTAYDSVEFGRRATERTTDGATHAATRVLGLASRMINPQQDPDSIRRILRGR